MGLARGAQGATTVIIFNAVAALFIFLRCVSRFWVIHQAGTEDYLIIAALVFSCGFTTTMAIQVHNGLGRRTETLSDEEVQTFLKLFYASIIIYNLGLTLVKLSILYQYLRFFVERRYRRAAWFLIGFVAIACIAFDLTSAFSCTPVATFWDKSLGGHCVDLHAFWLSFTVCNIVTDIVVWILPMPILYKLQLPKKQKFSLITVFTLGGFGCITAILRVRSLYIAFHAEDRTYDQLGAAIWSGLELNVGAMCACIPALRPVIRLIFPRFVSSTRRDRTTATYPSRDVYRHQNESTIELSHVPKAHSEVSRDDMASLEQHMYPNSIQVKNEWTISESQ